MSQTVIDVPCRNRGECRPLSLSSMWGLGSNGDIECSKMPQGLHIT
jgi:hypothetical protein